MAQKVKGRLISFSSGMQKTTYDAEFFSEELNNGTALVEEAPSTEDAKLGLVYAVPNEDGTSFTSYVKVKDSEGNTKMLKDEGSPVLVIDNLESDLASAALSANLGKALNEATNKKFNLLLNNFLWVDLGLPSGTLWATCNLGASNSQGDGKYYLWGNTEGSNNAVDTWNTSNINGNFDAYNEYYVKTNIDNFTEDNRLSKDCDPCYWEMGNDWRLPTSELAKELLLYCSNSYKNSGLYLYTSLLNGKQIYIKGKCLLGDIPTDDKVSYFESGESCISNTTINKALQVRPVCKIANSVTDISKKVGYKYLDSEDCRYLYFTDERSKDLYLLDPEKYKDLIIFDGEVTLTSKINIDILSPSSVVVTKGETTCPDLIFTVTMSNLLGNPIQEDIEGTLLIENDTVGVCHTQLIELILGQLKTISIEELLLKKGNNVITIRVKSAQSLTVSSKSVVYEYRAMSPLIIYNNDTSAADVNIFGLRMASVPLTLDIHYCVVSDFVPTQEYDDTNLTYTHIVKDCKVLQDSYIYLDSANYSSKSQYSIFNVSVPAKSALLVKSYNMSTWCKAAHPYTDELIYASIKFVFPNSGSINLYGDLSSLIGNKPLLEYSLSRIFSSWLSYSLREVYCSLPYTNLTDGCYSSMFRGNHYLSKVPSTLLPATNMAPYCYRGMFLDAGLSSAPNMTIKSLATKCFEQMFRWCSYSKTYLTDTSNIKIEAVAASTDCMYYMFYAQSKMIKGPKVFKVKWEAGLTSGIRYAFNGTHMEEGPEAIYGDLGTMYYAFPNTLKVAPIVYGNAMNSYTMGFPSSCPFTYIKVLGDYYRTNSYVTLLPKGLKTLVVKSSLDLESINCLLKGVEDCLVMYYPYKIIIPDIKVNTESLSIPITLNTSEDYHFISAETSYPNASISILDDTHANLTVSGVTESKYIKLTFDIGGDSSVEVYKEIQVVDTKLSPVKFYNSGTDNSDIRFLLVVDLDASFTYSSYSGLMSTQSNVLYAKVSNYIPGLEFDDSSVVYTVSTLNEKVTVSPGETLLVKSYKMDSVLGYHFNIIGGSIEAYGDITSLQNGQQTALFPYLFLNCTGLVQGLEVPFETLEYDRAYQQMYNGCSNLKKCPLLPATALTAYCYREMFKGCSTLTEGASFMECNLLTSCYEEMYSNCTSLLLCPPLKALLLASGCYSYTFSGCTSLTSIPELHSIPLEEHCYKGMFLGCSGLLTIPDFPDVPLASSCYNSMFLNCTGLTRTNKLQAKILDTSCYNNMFKGCTNLTEILLFGAESLSSYCFYGMFEGCTSLETVPSNLLGVLTLQAYCYSRMFFECTSLKEAPILPARIPKEACYLSMFSYCSSLTKIVVLLQEDYSSRGSLIGGYLISKTGTFYYLPNTDIDWEVYSWLAEWDIVSYGTLKSYDSLTINAKDVPGLKTYTTVTWTLLTTYVIEGEEFPVTLTGNVTSASFEQNTSTTETIERVITYTEPNSGLTATTTIVLGIWRDEEYTVDLNSLWLESGKNPDPSLYECYESFSNKGVNSANAIMYVDIIGYDEFTLYIRSNAESTYDFTVASFPDVTPILAGANSTTNKVTTKSNQKSGTDISNYTEVAYTGLGGGNHRITILYGKDGSSALGDDRGYLIIPKDQ